MPLSVAEIAFFEAHPNALPIYEACAQAVGSWEGVVVRVQKTQITFSSRHVFACASFLRVRKKAAMPPVFLTLSLGLPAPIESPRLDGAVEPYPGRWTNHIVVASVEEIDSELLGWASEARFFSELKGR